MNYGYINKDTTIDMCHKICKCLGYGANNIAHKLIYETGVAETGFGRVTDKTLGAGMGITQFDKLPFDDIKRRSLHLKDKILTDLGVDISLVEWEHLRYNPYLCLIFTRLLYKLVTRPIPLSIEERAEYWKEFYNTKLGKGTPEHYLEMNKSYGGWL